MISHYYVDNDICKVRAIDGNFHWFVMNHLYELVNNDKYWIIAVPFLILQNWQIRDKIY